VAIIRSLSYFAHDMKFPLRQRVFDKVLLCQPAAVVGDILNLGRFFAQLLLL
jgi:hypothetical protein